MSHVYLAQFSSLWCHTRTQHTSVSQMHTDTAHVMIKQGVTTQQGGKESTPCTCRAISTRHTQGQVMGHVSTRAQPWRNRVSRDA